MLSKSNLHIKCYFILDTSDLFGPVMPARDCIFSKLHHGPCHDGTAREGIYSLF